MAIESSPLRPLHYEFLMEIRADLDLQIIGDTPAGHRRIYPIKGGWFKGPVLEGEVLPGGSDAFLVRPDGVGTLDVRATLKTIDGDLIYVTYQGRMHHVPSLEAKLIAGEAVPSTDYYFRIAPLYETASEKYAWLNQIVAIGVGEADLGGVSYTVYRVL